MAPLPTCENAARSALGVWWQTFSIKPLRWVSRLVLCVLEDYNESYEFALFGEDYVKFRNMMVMMAISCISKVISKKNSGRRITGTCAGSFTCNLNFLINWEKLLIHWLMHARP
jgi:hypothetical protein